MKVVLNKCFGGFSVTEAVYGELGIEWDNYGFLRNDDFNIESDNYAEYRTHPPLIEAIEKIGVEKASGAHAKLAIVDIPDDIKWELDEYDGIETIHEQHRSWQ